MKEFASPGGARLEAAVRRARPPLARQAVVFAISLILLARACADDDAAPLEAQAADTQVVQANASLAGWIAEVDTNATSLAVFPWGDPRYTDGDFNTYPRPSWAPEGWMEGGLWTTNDAWYGWQSALGDWQPDLATNRLLVHIDRSRVASNLWVAVACTVETNAILLAGLYDDNLHSVSIPVALHTSAAEPWFTNRLNLARTPSASVISFSSTNGMIRIFNSVLSEDIGDNGDQETPDAPASPPGEERNESSRGSGTSTNNIGASSPAVAGPARQTTRASPVARTGLLTWYVDKAQGDDSLLDGLAEVHVPSTSTGPKRSIAAALTQANRGESIFVAGGSYPEHVRIDGVRIVTTGRVVLQ